MGSSTDWNQEEITKDKNMSVTRVGKTHCCYCSVSQSCPTLFNLTHCRTPGLPVPHHFLKFAQVHVCCIGDAIQPSHSLIPFSPSVLCLSQHQGLFQWVSCSHQMTKILEHQLQHQFFQWVLRINFPQDWLIWSPCCPMYSQASSPTLQCEGINYLALCLPYGPALTIIHDHWEDHSLDYTDLCQQSNVFAFQHIV